MEKWLFASLFQQLSGSGLFTEPGLRNHCFQVKLHSIFRNRSRAVSFPEAERQFHFSGQLSGSKDGGARSCRKLKIASRRKVITFR
ncbi:MAG: hypothetical protein FWH27_14210, partial [Planctomycetaceae bacterium]|nr:hypothetical protein [Planctomycetaceae bacterium]